MPSPIQGNSAGSKFQKCWCADQIDRSLLSCCSNHIEFYCKDYGRIDEIDTQEAAIIP